MGEPTGQHGYTGTHEPQPDGRCKHRWANRLTRYVVGCAEQQRLRADAALARIASLEAVLTGIAQTAGEFGDRHVAFVSIETAARSALEASAVPTCRECGQAKDAPDHDWQKLVSDGTQPPSVHAFFPASAVPEPTDRLSNLDIEFITEAAYPTARAFANGEIDYAGFRRELAARLAATPPGPHTSREETR